MAAALCNYFSPTFSNSSSLPFKKEVKYFGNTKNISVGMGATKKLWSVIKATSKPSTAQGSHFDPNDNIFQVDFPIEYEEKLEKIRKLLESREEEKDRIESLIFVDTIQRLGMAGHFQKEIDTITQQYYYFKLRNTYTSTIHGDHSPSPSPSLREVSLSFRLLRRKGYHISADVFKNFKGKDGKFRDDLKQDIWGLMELYEASHLSFEGENILDQAQEFSSKFLYEYISAAKSKCSNVVRMRLRHPYHKTIAKLNSSSIRDVVVGGAMNTTWIPTLKELSILDSRRRKHVHNQELLQVSKWWNDLGLRRELKLARNQPVKWYTWSMAILNDDISVSEERVQLTKSIAFIYLIDDIFDLYGTPHELTIFTEAVKKWEYGAMDMLPDYMKLCYKSLLDTTNLLGHTIYKKHGYNPINSLKQTWASLCNAFLVEAKWFTSKNLPGAEEYLANGMVSSGVHVVLVHLFFILGEGGTNLDEISSLISRVAAILRLWDDLGSAENEHQNGTDGSYIECYMKDHPGSQFEQAREQVVDMIEREWKRLNKESFHLNNNHSSFKEAALNGARMVPLMYNYDDKQRLPLLEEYVKLMFDL